MRLLALSGSLRAASTNTALLNALAEHSPADFDIEVFDGLGDLPLFSPDLEDDPPESVLRLAGKVEACDGLLISCPEYAHGIPGAFKNALDWLVSRFEIPGKPVMLVHASTRSAFLRAHLHEVLKTISCRLFPGPEFEVHLIKKTPRETRDILSAPDMRAAMRSKLEDFERFATQEG